MSFKLLRNTYRVAGEVQKNLPIENKSRYWTDIHSGIKNDRISERLKFKSNMQVYDLEYTGYDDYIQQHTGSINGGATAWLELDRDDILLEPNTLTSLGIRKVERMVHYGNPKNNDQFKFPDP